MVGSGFTACMAGGGGAGRGSLPPKQRPGGLQRDRACVHILALLWAAGLQPGTASYPCAASCPGRRRSHLRLPAGPFRQGCRRHGQPVGRRQQLHRQRHPPVSLSPRPQRCRAAWSRFRPPPCICPPPPCSCSLKRAVCPCLHPACLGGSLRHFACLPITPQTHTHTHTYTLLQPKLGLRPASPPAPPPPVAERFRRLELRSSSDYSYLTRDFVAGDVAASGMPSWLDSFTVSRPPLPPQTHTSCGAHAAAHGAAARMHDRPLEPPPSSFSCPTA